MNYKMQLSPISVTHSGVQPSLLSREDARFFRSWLVYDSDLETSRTSGRLNWNMIASFAVIASVSTGGWFGIAMLVRSFLK
ncbi:MAG: hypothetical protein WAL56_20715 [Candidatus Sulfotelmatobacter sp.]|jgi:hypothetical protein